MYIFVTIWSTIILTWIWTTIEGTLVQYPAENLFELSTEVALNDAVSKHGSLLKRDSQDPRCSAPFLTGLCKSQLIKALKKDIKKQSCKTFLQTVFEKFCQLKLPSNDAKEYCELLCDKEVCNSIFDPSNCNTFLKFSYYYHNGRCKHAFQLDCASDHFSSLKQCEASCLVSGPELPVGPREKRSDIILNDIEVASCNCQNGGRCIDPLAKICACPTGYMGNSCDKFYCEEFCENGGTCTGPLSCTCPKAYSTQIDPFCKQAVCDLNCGSGGYCEISKSGQPICVCHQGYSGALCDEEVVKKLPLQSGVCKTYIDDFINNTDSYVNVFASVKEKSYCLSYINDISLRCHSKQSLPRYSLENCYHFCDLNRTGNICGLVFGTSCPSSNQYGYDEAINQCVEFQYKGCLGNKNSYNSLELCEMHYLNTGLKSTLNRPMNNTCFVRDKLNYNTFDGLNYQLLTGCSYFLVHDTDSESNFDIIVNNDPNVNYNTTVKRTLDIKVDGKAVHLGQKIGDLFIVRVDGNLVSLPYDGAPKIKLAGRYIMVITSDQVIITFDGREDITITVPDSYRTVKTKNHRLVGLCGNLDGDNTNDWVDFNGIQRQSANEFASVFQSNKGSCSENLIQKSLFYNPTGNSDFVYENAERLCSVIETEAFEPCHDLVDYETYKLICMQEVVYCNYNLRSDCVCSSLSFYAKLCLKLGKEIKWRAPDLCPVTCKGDMQYYDCGSACPKMCNNLMSSTKCVADCVDGCHCPPDLYFDTATDRCLPRSQCSCYRDGVRYPHGSVRSGQCEDCTCNGGTWSCAKKPCAASCHIYGDPHIKTFDGKQYDMYGQCNYVLVDHCHYGTGKKEFEIIVKNSQCGDNKLYTSCVRSLLVNLTTLNTRINFDSISDSAGNKYPLVSVNGVETTFLSTDHYQIAVVGDENIILQYQKTKFMVHWTGENIYITVGHEFENQTCGLCGTYNQNKQDDFHTRSDSVETSATAFTQAWIYNDKDVNQDPLKCHSSLWETSEKPCQIYSTYLPFAKDSCSILSNSLGPFAACHNVVPPAFHYESCLQDACKCQNCYCSVVSQYAKLCMDKGILVHGWRDEAKGCSIQCPFPKIHRQCNTDITGLMLKCPATCHDISTNDTSACSNRGCIEGCFCPEGYYEDNNQECVKKENCPCFHNNLIYQFGDTRQDRCNNCTCIGGKFECTSLNCEAHCEEKGLQYSDCGLTCSNFKLTKQDLRCQSGCFCPNGKVLHENGTCVEPTQCQCKEADQFFNIGDVSPSDCAKVCNGDRTWRQLPGVDSKPQYDCAAFGQMHYRTFDGKMYKFDGGKCQYIMMSDCKQHSNNQFCDLLQANFNVRIRNTRCVDSYEQYMCKEVTVELRMFDGSMAEIVMLQENVVVNHLDTKLSFKKGNYPQPRTNVIDGVEIFKSGLFIIVRAYKLDYTVKYDQHNRVYIIPGINHKWAGNFAGLCGDFNGKDEDDFQKLDNLPADNALQFAKSWADEASTCAPPTDVDSCSGNPDYLAWAQKGCNIIQTGNFTQCHKVVNPEPFIESCKQETCLCKSGGDCACFCSAVSAYVQECNRHGVPIYWRREGLCKLDCCDPCGHSYGYYADNQVPKTCNEQKQKCNPKERCCKGAIVEGCGCPEGTYDDGQHCQNMTDTNNIICTSSILPSSHISSTLISSSISSSVPVFESSFSISSSLETPLLTSTAEFISSSPSLPSSVSTNLFTSSQIQSTTSITGMTSSYLFTSMSPPSLATETLEVQTTLQSVFSSIIEPSTSTLEMSSSIISSETLQISLSSTFFPIEPTTSVLTSLSTSEIHLTSSSPLQTVIVESSSGVTESQKVQTSFVSESSTQVLATSIAPPVTTLVATSAPPPLVSSVETVSSETSTVVAQTSSYVVSVFSESSVQPPATTVIEPFLTTVFVNPTTSLVFPETSYSEFILYTSVDFYPSSFVSPISTFVLPSPTSTFIIPSFLPVSTLPRSLLTDFYVTLSSAVSSTALQGYSRFSTSVPKSLIFPSKSIHKSTTITASQSTNQLISSFVPPMTTLVATSAPPPLVSSVETVSSETSTVVAQTSSYVVSVSSESSVQPPATTVSETPFTTEFVHPTTSVVTPETVSSTYIELPSTTVLPETSFISLTSTYVPVEPTTSVLTSLSTSEIHLTSSSPLQTVIVESSSGVTESQKVQTSFVSESSTQVLATSIAPPVTTLVATSAPPPLVSSVETVSSETSTVVAQTSSYVVTVSIESSVQVLSTIITETPFTSEFVNPTSSFGFFFTSLPSTFSTSSLLHLSTFSSSPAYSSLFVGSSILPTSSSLLTIPTSSVYCPACYYEGSFYAVGEVWQDAHKCTNFTCKQVSNPCYPSNTSVQIEAETHICQACPSGYKSVSRSYQCCPDCIPIEDTSCKRKVFGMQKLVEEDTEIGRCESTKPYLITGCSGLCDSSIKATIGSNVFTPTCSCCQPSKVVSFNVTMECVESDYTYTVLFHDIISCQCSSNCQANANGVQLGESSSKKRSMTIKDTAKSNNLGTLRHRRSLFNDIALVLSKRNRR